MFYNTGIATYILVLSNKKPKHLRSKVQLIDAREWYKLLRKNLAKKKCELSAEDIDQVVKTFVDFKEVEHSKIFDNKAFGYWKVTAEYEPDTELRDGEHPSQDFS
jgi:type I restriction enzyme M protein